MKKIISIFCAAFLVSAIPLMAYANEDIDGEGEQDAEEVTTTSAPVGVISPDKGLTEADEEEIMEQIYEEHRKNRVQETYVLLNEEIIESSIIRTYKEKSSGEKIFIYIDFPSEIELAVRHLNGLEKEKRVYELLSSFYIENDSWIKLNELVNQYSQFISPYDKMAVDKNANKEVLEKWKVVKKAIMNDGEFDIEVEEKVRFIDPVPIENMEEFLKFSSIDSANDFLTKEMKELRDNTKYYFIFFILLGIVSIVVVNVVIKKFNRR